MSNTRRAGRPVWLITLADLSLLLLGFFVLIQSNRQLDGRALTDGLREGFGVAPIADTPAPIALGIARIDGFAPGAARSTAPHAAAIAWAREAGRDPRTRITITGRTDGSAADRDAATGSGAILAADRARLVAVQLARSGAIHTDRIVIATGRGVRSVDLAVGFAGTARSLLQGPQRDTSTSGDR